MMARCRVVIVEDELIVAEDLRRTLGRLGYAVEGMYSTGERALAEMARSRPDLALMDIRLAGVMDGIEAARQLRARLGVSIVFITAHSDEATVRRARDVADGFVFKPLEEHALGLAIEGAIRKKAAAAGAGKGRQ